ncbi:GNAT family N-acetyltransferase [Lacticaseibacillus zhaodongensis]|uniref:GNAT family N-acetyltransferase n=1 Tax=Lacticaseibacillus zhaodongensis TaxID=2668065 RepID=UPI0012D3678F|nr:GNAT family N-acetyltransferase [Lacticaseibacillus zhaodongensis]
MKLRSARQEDLAAIVAIYNQSIASHKVTADMVPVTVAQRQPWFAAHNSAHWPLFVVQQANQVVGWVSLSPYKQRAAYDATAEISIYLDANVRGQGLGTAVLTEVEHEGARVGISTIVALVIAANTASRGLFSKAGYAQWGLLPDVMDFGGQKQSLLILGKQIA